MIQGTELDRRVEEATVLLDSSGITAVNRKLLQNGIKITFTHSGRSCGCNFYYSKKKGFSVVPAGGDSQLSQKIKTILMSDSLQLPYEYWTGSDEVGINCHHCQRGQMPLYSDRKRAETYSNMGITDSKVLSNDSVRKYAESIRRTSGGLFSIVSISPQDYNSRFSELSKKGMNSLDLLAECHAEAIRELLKMNLEPQCMIIDKFCNEERISHLLPEGDYTLELRIRGESDPAVAAASILARDEYLSSLDRISMKYGIKAVSGSGRKSDDVVREYVRKFGADILDETVKLHFRNTLKVMSLFS